MDRGSDSQLNVLLMAELVRIHVGCASKRLRKYVNVDVRKTSVTDLVCAAWDLEQHFSPGSVRRIYCRHTLEHLDPDEAEKTLRSWYRLLSAEGKAHIIVPDIEFHAKQLLGLVSSTYPDQLEHALHSLYGWQEPARGGSQYDAHKWGYTFNSLRQKANVAGFGQVARVTEGVDSEPWHLNVLCYKTAPVGI
jgi:predicted SAM-dependent methyltransferase